MLSNNLTVCFQFRDGILCIVQFLFRFCIQMIILKPFRYFMQGISLWSNYLSIHFSNSSRHLQFRWVYILAICCWCHRVALNRKNVNQLGISRHGLLLIRQFGTTRKWINLDSVDVIGFQFEIRAVFECWEHHIRFGFKMGQTKGVTKFVSSQLEQIRTCAYLTI
jgi:hypothetical protein